MSAAYTTVTATGNTVVTTGPTELVAITTMNNGAAHMVTVRDGAGGPVVAVLTTTSAYLMAIFCPAVPILLTRGIDVTIAGTTPLNTCFYYV